uniref:Reverse transcriptase domain-containing protein n=1 Tax=Haemonchus contortus TaxID=6289 RepID=A0A7I4YQW8_HAECO
MKFRKRNTKNYIDWDIENYIDPPLRVNEKIIDNIYEEYSRLVGHLHDSARKAARENTSAWNRASYRQSPTNVRTCGAMQRSDKERVVRRSVPIGSNQNKLTSLSQVIIKTLARLFTRYLSECKVPTSWKTSKTVLLYKKGDPDDIGNYRPICLLSVIYKLFTRVILNRIGRILDEGQPCEQAGFRRGFNTIDHIHTVTRLIEVSREYKMPLCLTFIDLKKAFDTVETEAVIEALGNQGVPTQYIRMLRELYDNFTTRISPFYKEVIVNVKRGVRQGDTISPKLFSAALENIMRHLEWEDLGVKVDGRFLHHLRFADDIVLITPNIEQAERMLAEFDSACGKIGLRLNLTKTMFIRNGLVPDAPFTLSGENISECSGFVYLGLEEIDDQRDDR